MTDFNDYNPQSWSYAITAEAKQDDTGKITSWEGTVKATRTVSREDEQTRDVQ